MGKGKSARGRKADGEGGGDKDDGQNISKSTNKVVTQMRIREIEKSVRSMSSILDNRTLFEMENVNKVDTASKKLTEAGKRSATNRRGNNTVQSSILNQGLLAAAALRTGGVKMANTTEEYGNEESIWKHKYRTPSYTQKRRFNNPKLHDYYKSLNGEEQKDFKQQCRDSLYAVSTTMRESVADYKAKMDERGVFHPAANAHRAHCSYLLKVYKHVDAATIEDPVLRSMRQKDRFAEQNDDMLPEGAGDSLDSPARESISRGPVFRATKSSQSKIRAAKNPRIFEKKVEKKSLASMFDMVALPMDDSAAGGGASEMEGVTPAAGRTGDDVEGGPNPQSTSNTANNTANNTACNTSAPLNMSNKSRQNSIIQPHSDAAVSSASSRVQSRAVTPSNAGIAEGGGMGRSESKSTRLRSASSGKFKTDEGGNLEGFTDSHTTDWMIGRLQREQMAAVVNSSGQQIALPLGKDGELSWKHLPELQLPLNMTLPLTAASPSGHGLVGTAAGSGRPQSPVISFTQFNDLFKSYSDQVAADLKKQADDAQEAQAMNLSDEGGGGGTSLSVDTKCDAPGGRGRKNSKSGGALPALSINIHGGGGSAGGSRKGSNGPGQGGPSTQATPTKAAAAGKNNSSRGGGSRGGDETESQRILDSMQPHLDAFVAVNISKKSNNIQMVQKMLSGIKKTPGGGMPRAATADARMTRRHGGVSELGKVAVQSIKNNNRVGRVYGFRNVFLQPESDADDSDDESDTSESQKSQSSSSEDSSEYDTDEEAQVLEVKKDKNQDDKGGKLTRKKTEKKIKAEDSSVIQERQMAIWEVLEIKTEDRVKLMNKYSSNDHSKEFRLYFSLWTEIALLVLFRQELKKVFLWYQRGLLSVPSDNPDGSAWVFLELLRRVPPLLKGAYTMATRNKKSVRAETSYYVLEKVRGFLTFEEDEEQQLGFEYPSSVLPFLHSTVKHFDRLLLEKLNEAEATLGDVVPFGGGSCKEWLMSKAQKFPVPKI